MNRSERAAIVRDLLAPAIRRRGPLDGLRVDAARAAGDDPGVELGTLGLRAVGLGWATVDLDRASEEHAAHGPFRTASFDELLGARALVGRRSPLEGTTAGRGPVETSLVVLLEPSTEGRLAGWLARHGEGWAVLYLGPASGSSSADGPGADGPSVVAELDALLGGTGIRTLGGGGPFGPSRLVRDGVRTPPSPAAAADPGPRSRPFLILVGEG